MNTHDVHKLISYALREDAAGKDMTTNLLVPADHISQGVILVKEDAVICGISIAGKVFKELNPHIRFHAFYKDGAKVKRNTKIATLKGKTRALLTGERTALNFLGYLCGIATNTHQFVQKTRRSKAKIFDTRKTTPGLRLLEKYAVQCGGGHNHRADLSGLVLIKDNHRQACQPRLSIPQAIEHVRNKTKKMIEVEVDNLLQFKRALMANPDIILLDNMTCAQMKKAVAIMQKISSKKKPLLEASGGITLHNVAAVAQTGVNHISVGALTHTHKAINVSMELR